MTKKSSTSAVLPTATTNNQPQQQASSSSKRNVTSERISEKQRKPKRESTASSKISEAVVVPEDRPTPSSSVEVQVKSSSKKKKVKPASNISEPAPASEILEEVEILEEEVSSREIADLVAEVVPSLECTSFTTEIEKKRRRSPTKESMITMVDEMITRGDKELEYVKANPENTSKEITRLLKDDIKTLKALRRQMGRVLSKKSASARPSSVTSGLQMPVTLSDEMARFIGCDPSSRKSRIEVTKDVCKYIKDHSLQNPENRREIVPDKSLSELLRYDPSKLAPGEKKLDYGTLQTYMKRHFVGNSSSGTISANI